jgi:uncharacterized protein YecE (DUF72 family)
MSILRYGTCSWKFPSWNGLVYSASDGINYLEEYARRYESVEIDQWFWSLFDTDQVVLPARETVAEYLGSVPSEFRFTIKAPNSITLTHFYKRGSQRGSGANPYFLSTALLDDFLERIEPMREQTGAIMLQFEYLNRQKMCGLEEFLEKTDAFLAGRSAAAKRWPTAIELRNPNYLQPRYFDLLAGHGVPHVYCHGYYLPPAPEVFRRAQVAADTPPPQILRLLGPDRQGIEKLTGKKWDRIVLEKDEELPSLADMIVEMISTGTDVYVNVNNHYEGSAPLTVEKLERLVDERRERFSQMRE